MAKYLYPFCIFLLLISFHSKSQCLSAPSAPPNAGLAFLPSNGDRIDLGETKWFSGGTSQTLSSFTLNGGTLVVCDGELSINAFQIDSGQIFVNSGATLNILASPSGSGAIQLRGNIGIYNRGTLNFKNILSFENTYASAAKPIVMINASGNSRLTVDNNWFIINTPHGKLVNNGYLSTHGLIIDAQAKSSTVCLSNSITEMTELHNKIPNAYTVEPGQTACIWVKNRSFPSDTLTASPNIKVALNNGHLTYTTKAHPWGVAEVINNSASCVSVFTVLPLNFKRFQALQNAKGNTLLWEMDNITAKDNKFIIEKSIDGKEFTSIASIDANGATNQFNFEDPSPFQKTYYRIKILNSSKGSYQYSSIQSVWNEQREDLSIYPNPISTSFTIQLPHTIKGEVMVVIKDLQGRLINQAKYLGNGNILIQCPPTMQPGVYVIQLLKDNQVITKKVLKH